jgi:pyoverdine/dityrosine biosynthesis protein Dit1
VIIQDEIDVIIQFHGWLHVHLETAKFVLEDLLGPIFKHNLKIPIHHQSIGNLGPAHELFQNKKFITMWHLFTKMRLKIQQILSFIEQIAKDFANINDSTNLMSNVAMMNLRS